MLPCSTRPAPTFFATAAAASSERSSASLPPASRTAASTERVSAARGPPSPVSLACIRSTIPCRRYCTLGSAPAVRNGSTATRSASSGRSPARSQGFQRKSPTAARTAALAAAYSHRSRRGCFTASADTGCVWVGVIPPLGAASGSSAVTSSSAVWNRSAGRLARQRITSASSPGGRPSRCCPTGTGVRVTCAASVCCGLSPEKGGAPVSIS